MPTCRAGIEQTLYVNWRTLFESPSQIVRCRLALMLKYFMRKIFVQRPEAARPALDFLLRGVMGEKKDKPLTLQCADSLKKIAKNPATAAKTQEFLRAAVPDLCRLVVQTEQLLLLEFVHGIVKHCAGAIGSNVVSFTQNLTRRIRIDFGRGNKTSIVVYRCWSIISSICETPDYVPAYLDGIESALIPLFAHLSAPKRVYFDENILQTMTTLLTLRKSASPQLFSCFAVFVGYYDRQSFISDALFKAVYAFLRYARDPILHSPELLTKLWRASLELIMDENAPIELGSAKTFILVQLALQTLGDSGLSDSLETVTNTIIDRAQHKSLAPYMRRELFGILLCIICANTEKPLKSLEQAGTLGYFLDCVLTEGKELRAHPYHVKVLTLGLSTIIMSYRNHPGVFPALGRIFRFVVELLHHSFVEELDERVEKDAIFAERIRPIPAEDEAAADIPKPRLGKKKYFMAHDAVGSIRRLSITMMWRKTTRWQSGKKMKKKYSGR